jgi:hypothetical protein
MGVELVWFRRICGASLLHSYPRVNSRYLLCNIRMGLALVGCVPAVLLAHNFCCSLRLYRHALGESIHTPMTPKPTSKINPFAIAKLAAIAMLTVPHFIDGHMPHGYYTLLRWIVCPILGLLAYQAYEAKRTPWAWVFGITAAIFNPIVPAWLGTVWIPVDFAAATLIVVSFFLRLNKPGGKLIP